MMIPSPMGHLCSTLIRGSEHPEQQSLNVKAPLESSRAPPIYLFYVVEEYYRKDALIICLFLISKAQEFCLLFFPFLMKKIIILH